MGQPVERARPVPGVVHDRLFYNALRNTFLISAAKLVIGFPVPIVFALMLNELKGMHLFKKGVQSSPTCRTFCRGRSSLRF